MQRISTLFLSIPLILSLALSALAQSHQGEFSAQVSGVFTKNTNFNNVTNSPSSVNHQIATNSVGLLFGYRYHFNSCEALEMEYGYTENGQRYYTPATAGNSSGLAYAITSQMHDIDFNEVITTPRLAGFFQPFILAGGGALIFVPTNNTFGPSSQTRAMFDYGAGLDFHIGHLGARVEYRGLIFQVPDFGVPALASNRYTHLAAPSVGLVFTF